MINPDKYKKNKFRKLVPTSTSQTDKFQQLATIQHEKEASRPQLIISQQIKRSSSKVGVEGVSQRHRQKHFVFERKLKTISSMNQREEQHIKHSNSAFGLQKLQRQKVQVKEQSKLQSLINVIEQFRLKAEKISKAGCLEQLGRIIDINKNRFVDSKNKMFSIQAPLYLLAENNNSDKERNSF